jgi:hypothetical protein
MYKLKESKYSPWLFFFRFFVTELILYAVACRFFTLPAVSKLSYFYWHVRAAEHSRVIYATQCVIVCVLKVACVTGSKRPDMWQWNLNIQMRHHSCQKWVHGKAVERRVARTGSKGMHAEVMWHSSRKRVAWKTENGRITLERVYGNMLWGLEEVRGTGPRVMSRAFGLWYEPCRTCELSCRTDLVWLHHERNCENVLRNG